MNDYSYIDSALYTFRALCTNVVDGDTIDVELDLGFDTTQKRRLRLLDVDTPERKQDKFLKAKQFTESAVLNKEIRVQTYKAGNFGRYLAHVYYPTPNGFKELSEELRAANLIKPNSKWNKE